VQLRRCRGHLVRRGVGRMLHGARRGDDPTAIVTDEDQIRHAHQAEHHQRQDDDDHEPLPTAPVRRRLWLIPKPVHPWLIGPFGQSLEGMRLGVMDATTVWATFRVVARPGRVSRAPVPRRIDVSTMASAGAARGAGLLPGSAYRDEDSFNATASRISASNAVSSI
jgi:hypothetical protein